MISKQSVANWSTKQHLTLIPQKYKFVTISRKKRPSVTPVVLKLNNSQLEEVDQFKYLGVVLSHNLFWSPHISISHLCKSLKNSRAQLYRPFYNHSSNKCIKQLYLSVLRPHLDHGAQMWDPYLHKDVQHLELEYTNLALKLFFHNWSIISKSLIILRLTCPSSLLHIGGST